LAGDLQILALQLAQRRQCVPHTLARLFIRCLAREQRRQRLAGVGCPGDGEIAEQRLSFAAREDQRDTTQVNLRGAQQLETEFVHGRLLDSLIGACF